MDKLSEFQRKVEEIERMRARMKRMQDGIMDSIKTVDQKYGEHQIQNVTSIGNIQSTLEKIKNYQETEVIPIVTNMD